MNNLVKGGLVAGGLMVAAAGLVIGAGVAKAEPSAYGEDTSGFVRALRADGFTGVVPSEAIQLGEMVCRWERRGMTQAEIIEYLVEPPHPVPRLVAVSFVTDANEYLCPGLGEGA